ncbi:DUF1330 domain-containing protein [Roseobacter ponti]|uniref:DUF1330 domain-containing protein n=1 Tax=Roseobacter ponti TaxID=1891787 RepID=A0A858SXL5_9RHOB|nr:DUF1330 domain-containing protein [Roseobacter ponti]QJF52582.1 DUF1330 domain-containing protein [Roseobacter ponti]
MTKPDGSPLQKNVYTAGLIEPDGILVTIQVQILQPEKLQAYVEGHAPSLAQYGGRLIYIGGDQETVEGDLPVGDIIAIHAWSSRERFLEWYNSDEYRPWKEYRQNGVTKATITLSAGFPLDQS